ncbi:MAG: OmpA family protein [Candidatus Cloacimonetes bacterium]|nr:OmpA family protein [Candidatus Cloacimonadota bacterium]
MKNLLKKLTLIQVLSLCFTASTFAEGPNTDGLVKTGDSNTAVVTTVSTGITESTSKFNYLSFTSLGKDRITTAFDGYLENPANAGLSLSFLKRFDKKSLESLKRYVYGTGASKELWAKLEELGASMEELDEARLELLDKDVKEEYFRLKKAAAVLQVAINKAEANSTSEDAKLELESLRKTAIAAQKKRDEYFQAELDKLKLSLSKIESEFGTNWFGSKYDDWHHLISEIKGNLSRRDKILTDVKKVEIIHEDQKPVKVSLYKELLSRLAYVENFASRAYPKSTVEVAGKDVNKRGLKFGASLLISWLFTRENINLALVGKVDSNTDPSEPDPKPSTGWTEEQAKLYVRMAQALNRKVDFSVGQGQVIKQVLVGMVVKYNKMVKDVDLPKMAELLKTDLKKTVEEKFLKDGRVTADAHKKIESLHVEYLAHLKKIDLARVKKEAHLVTLKGILKKYKIDESYVEKWQDVKKTKEMIITLVKSGVDRSEVDSFVSNLREYTRAGITEAMSAAYAWDAYVQMKKIYNGAVDSVEKDELEIVNWIKGFDTKRDTSDKKQYYGKVLSEVLVMIKEEKESKVDMLNTAFGHGYSDCLKFYPNSLKEITITTNSYPAALAKSRITSDVSTKNHKRQVCFASYEWNLKERLKEGKKDYIFSQNSAPEQNAYGYSIETIIKSMGESRAASVKVTANNDHSLYEGFTELMVFVKNIRSWIVKIVKKEFADKGTEIKEGLQTDQGDNINFVIPGDTLFPHGKSTLSAAGKESLKKSMPILIEVLGEYSEVLSEVLIEGHASSPGKATYNKRLSNDRANAVYRYCVSSISGFTAFKAKAKVRVVAKGETELIYKEENGVKKEDQTASRRVVVKFSLDKAKIAAIKSNVDALLRLKQKIATHFPAERVNLQAK